jgi:3-phosphoshikimate 1-carboxyvinyltransferase
VAKKTIAPARTISGAVELPGDKSISHRYAILAALAEGRSEIRHFSTAQDCRSTLDCLRRLGVAVEANEEAVRISGVGLRGLQASRRDLDAGNSGTTMRLLAGVLSGQTFPSTLTGDSSLRRRPMRRVIEPLAQMGAQIRTRDGEFAPLEICGAALHSIAYALPVASAQVKSAILLAGLFAEGETVVEEPVRTRDHLELALVEFGAAVSQKNRTVSVRGGSPLRGRALTVPGDLSSVVFFLAAALLLPGSQLLIHNAGLNPTRTAVLDFLSSIGAPLKIISVQIRDGELVGDIVVSHGPLSGGSISGAAVAQMIDELPMLAALGPFTEQGIEIYDARELRVKESDRIATLAENLRRMGAQVAELPDGLRVAGRASGKLHGAVIEPHQDHRMAMAFAVAALAAEGDSVVRDAECASISFPEFFATLDRIVER